MNRFAVEILLAAVLLTVAVVVAASWWVVLAGVSGVMLGFAMYRSFLAHSISNAVLANMMNKVGG